MGETYRHKWTLEADDRTKAAFATATQNARGLDKQLAQLAKVAGPGGILGAIGAGATVGLVSREINETADSFDDLAKRARSLGMVSEDLDALEYAAARARVPSEQLGVAMKTLMRQMADTARGTGEGKVAFEALGIQVTDSNGRLKSATSMMAEIADKAGTLATAEERAAMMQKLFGESGVGMVNMLGNGAAGFREMVAEGYSLGARYEEMTARGEAYKDAQLRLNRSMRLTKDTIISQVLPGLTILAEAMSGHVVRAVSGLDEEFRTFLGTMRTLPSEMALRELTKQEEDLAAQVDVANGKLEQQRQAAIDMRAATALPAQGAAWQAPEQRFMQAATAESAEARAKLAAVREEIARLRQETQRSAEVEEFYRQKVAALGTTSTETAAETDTLSKSRGNLATATRGLTDAQREAAAVLEGLRTPQDELAIRTALLFKLFQGGHLTITQFTLAFAKLRGEFTATAEVVDDVAVDFDDFKVDAEKSLTAVQTAGVAAAGAINSGFSDMLRGQMASIEDFERFALDSFARIAEALWQSLVIDKMVAGITSSVSGGGSSSGSLNGIPGVPVVVGANKAGAMPPLQINISAVDTAGAVKVLRQQEGLIVGMVQKAYNRAGKAGPNG